MAEARAPLRGALERDLGSEDEMDMAPEVNTIALPPRMDVDMWCGVVIEGSVGLRRRVGHGLKDRETP
jgi:hypothetical protein